MTELGMNENVQEFDNFLASKSEKKLFFNFFQNYPVQFLIVRHCPT